MKIDTKEKTVEISPEDTLGDIVKELSEAFPDTWQEFTILAEGITHWYPFNPPVPILPSVPYVPPFFENDRFTVSNPIWVVDLWNTVSYGDDYTIEVEVTTPPNPTVSAYNMTYTI